jgi:hypothetical protein
MTEQEEILHEKFELIQAFAQDRRLKISKTDQGEKVIAGRLGESHIYQYSLTELAVAFVPNKWTPKTWGNHKRAAIALGMILRQNGDSEGTLSFDPANGPQSTLALRIAKARAKRILSPERAAAAAARLAKARLARLAGLAGQNVAQNAQNPHQNGPLGV